MSGSYHPHPYQLNVGYKDGAGTSSSSPIMNQSQGHPASEATDDEDSDGKNSISYKERRREAHTAAEQKRRDAIKKGYDALQTLVPTCQQTDASGHKVSKAVVLQKSIDFIQHLSQQKKRQEGDLNTLRREVVALQIMRANYEQLVKAHQQTPAAPEDLVPDEVKFQVFQVFIDSLFQSFNQQVSMNNFAELSGCVFSWIEEQCKPGDLQDLMYSILRQAPTKQQTSREDSPGPVDPAYQRNTL
eukprot:GFUD01010574.1.p1 GENE.GFUD01010574.1~~GFUD01010574.1.p1  ORF type:complete len:244 (-),score=53.87 GFUD01010574.1:220-951(-)